METLLQILFQMFVYIDDVFIAVISEEEHLKNLNETRERLEKAGIRFKEEKSALGLPTVFYLGCVLSADGICPSKKNVQAILAALAPEDSTLFRLFLGMVTYYIKFILNLS